MSDVGDAVTLTFSTTTGADVTAEVTHDGSTGTPVAVAEDGASGDYPFTFVGTTAGVWQVVFRSSGTATAVEEYQVTFRAVSDPPPLASPEDVADLWRPLTTAETSVARTLLRYASKMIRGRVADIDARITSGDLDSDLAALVAARMVLRVMQNPAGAVKSQTVGPYSVTYDTASAAQHLVVDPADLALLAAPQTETVLPVGSIALAPGLGTRWW